MAITETFKDTVLEMLRGHDGWDCSGNGINAAIEALAATTTDDAELEFLDNIDVSEVVCALYSSDVSGNLLEAIENAEGALDLA